MAILCPDGTCPIRDGEIWLYRDAGHFSADGSARFVRRALPVLQ
jgi:hypothetical protein